MPHRKLHIAAQAAGFAMVNQDSFDNQSEFFVRLEKDSSEAKPTAQPAQRSVQSNSSRSWFSTFGLRGTTA